MENNLKRAIDTELSGMQLSPARCALLTENALEGQKTMKKKMSVGFILVTALLLIAVTAMALGITWSAQYSTKRNARSTVMETYGLSAEAMEMLMGHVSTEDGKKVATFELSGNPEINARIGVYTAVEQPDGTFTVSWTYDDVDPAVYADGSPEAEVWGNKQIETYRAQRDEAHRKEIAEWEALYLTADVEATDLPVITPTPTQAPAGRMTAEEALTAAMDALKSKFGFTDDTLTLYQPEQIVLQDGMWQVIYVPSYLLSDMTIDTFFDDQLGTYTVTLNDVRGEVTACEWSLRAEEGVTYTRATFGQAKAFTPDVLPYLKELLDELKPYRTIYDSIEGCMSVESKAAYDQLLRDAGFDAALNNHVLPRSGDMTYEEAVEIVAQVLESEAGVSREVFDASVFAYADLTQEHDGRQWYFWVQNFNKQCTWSVLLNAETREVIDVFIDPMAIGEG